MGGFGYTPLVFLDIQYYWAQGFKEVGRMFFDEPREFIFKSPPMKTLKKW